MIAQYPGTKSSWQGFDCYTFRYRGRECLIVAPDVEAPGRPWVWRAIFFGHEPQTDIALLQRGYHVAHMRDIAPLHGNAAAVGHWDAFYALLTDTLGFAPKAVLEGFSRGGLIIYNWAARNPDKVACMYGDAPVCDIRSWPGGKGAGHGSPPDWQQCKRAHRLSEASAAKFKGSPIDNLAPLAKAGVPILHVIGEADTAVPVAENSDIVEKRYRELGGPITVIRKPGCEHHPHSLKDPTPIVNFILRCTPGMAAVALEGIRGKVWHDLRDGLDNCRVAMETKKRARVAFLGGSITESRDGWRDLTCRNLQSRFPQTKFDFVNAGISSIDSTGDAFRTQRDVLARGPVDLLFIDASVNDLHNERDARARVRAMEGIIQQVRRRSPAADIVILCFIDARYLGVFARNEMPPVIASHLRVARHYRTASINLAKEVCDRISAGQFEWSDFRDCHPSPFGHQLYAKSIERMFDAAWAKPPATKPSPHAMPKPLDKRSYARAGLVDIVRAKRSAGWKIDECWKPSDGVGGREGFSNVPALVTQTPWQELSLRFSGTAVGMFVAAGPDAGVVNYCIDGGPKRTFDLYTRWSQWLHIPWAAMLDDDLPPGKHELFLWMDGQSNPASKGTACRIIHFLVNQ
ncbi:MAG: GDSL-type esterase/lipase family protein [Planctomycetaceae bacterium]|nr:GDSL-type esterase/lipase family protein [Planctomycetaceae bacterium]